MAAGDSVTLRKKLEKHLDELPVLPTAVAKLMLLDRDRDDYTGRVVEIVESEPNFSVRLISAANSALSAPLNPITSLRGAILRLGSRSASNLILSLAVTRVFVPRDAWEKSLWRHSLQVAVAARHLAHGRGGGVLPDEAYACGLLHDVGRFVMFQEAPEALRRIDEADWETPEQLVAQERSVCGLTHTELGALACSKWHMPEMITLVVREHHTLHPLGLEPRVAHLIGLVRFADLAMFPSAMPGTPGWEAADDDALERLLLPKQPASLNLGLQELRQLLTSSAQAAAELAQTLGLG